MKKALVYLQGITLLLSLIGTGAQAKLPGTEKIAPETQAALAALPTGQKLTVIVRLNARADLRLFKNLNRKDRLKGVVKGLQATADLSQGAISALLQLRQGQGQVAKFANLWVMNGLSVTASAAAIQELAALPVVASITPDETKIVPTSISSALPAPNLTVVGASDVWNQSFYGQGVVVANLDSGVDVSHPDLSAKWRGGTNSWFDPYGQHPSIPTDLSGHGTGTMGIIVGGETNGTSFGFAPQAKWIAAKIFKDNGTATATAIHQAFQWLLDPDGNPATDDAPQVVNNSWAYGTPGCNLEFQPDLQALVSAGIVPVFAAGNYGPYSNTSVSPANYPEAFAVAATSNTDQWYSSSSVGASNCGEVSAIYPELVAPGVNVTTTDLYGLYTSSTGTSMSAPHVSGALALLLNAYPNLTAAQQVQALINSAKDLGNSGPDTIYGYGRLNLAGAYNFLWLNGGNPPPPIDTTGPLTSGVSASPNPNNGTLGVDANTPAVRLCALVDDPVSSGVQSSIANAEAFVDSVSANGTGFPASASDGAFNSPTEPTCANIPLAIIALLSEGNHNFYLHGQDSVGNWGAAVGTSFIIDKTPPAVSLVSASPNPSDGGTIVTLSASAVDAASTVGAAEWFIGADPGAGHGTAMGITGTSLATSINTSTWAPGNYTLSVRAQDAAGNWSATTPTVLVKVASNNTLFSDSFESSNLKAWNGGITGTRLSVTTGAALAGTYGMLATLGSNTTASYVSDITPALELSYHARFYFNPHGALTGNGNVVTLFSGLNASNATLFQVQYRINGSSASSPRQIRMSVQRAGGSTTSNWFTITNNVSHPIEIAWQSATSASASLYTDGTLRQALTGLNTSAYRLDTVRLGVLDGLVKTASGTFYFDAFASTKNAVIGP
jgi:serine protease AprX